MPTQRCLSILFVTLVLVISGSATAGVQTQIASVLEQLEVSENSRHPKRAQLMQTFMNDSLLDRGCYLFYADYVVVRRDDGPRPAGKVTATLELLREDGEEVTLGTASGKPIELFPGVFLAQLELEREVSLQPGDSILWTFKFKNTRRCGPIAGVEVSGQVYQFSDSMCDFL